MADVVPNNGLLTTVGNVKNYLKINAEATTDDALISRIVLAVSAWIKSYLNRDIVSTTYTELLDCSGNGFFCLGNYPVMAIASLAVGPPNTTRVALVAGTDYIFSDTGVVRVFGRKLPRGMATILINYTAGYVDVPADIEGAAIELAAWRYKESERIGQSSKSVGGNETVSFQTTDVPADVKTTLANWRKVAPL
jgi:hypothetical protein